MAISFVSATTGSASSSSSAAVTLPSNASGDLALILFTSVDGYANNISIGSLASGWAQVTGSPLDAGENWNRSWLVYKVVGASESNPTFSGWSAASDLGWAVAVYRDVDGTTPFDITPSTWVGTDSTTQQTPSVSPVSANTWMVACATAKTSSFSGAGWTTNASMTERVDEAFASYRQLWVADEARASSGATGTRDHTVSLAYAQMGWVLSLRDASGSASAPKRSLLLGIG